MLVYYKNKYKHRAHMYNGTTIVVLAHVHRLDVLDVCWTHVNKRLHKTRSQH